MNNMITLQHTEIKASFEASTHVIRHVFKVTLYKKLLVMFKSVNYIGIDNSRCGCVMRNTHGIPCACKLARYVVSSIPFGKIHMFWRRLSFSNQGLSKSEEIAYPNLNSMCTTLEKIKTKGAQKKPMTKHERSTKIKSNASSSEQAKPRRIMPMLDQFHPCIHDSIENIVDDKADGNCGYRAIISLLGIGEDSWSLVIMDKWMNITDMGYVIASRYNVIIVSFSLQQSMTFFHLEVNHQEIILFIVLYVSVKASSSYFSNLCNKMCFDNLQFVCPYVTSISRDCCPLLPVALLWSTHCHYQAKQ
ncbi:hypothetical protein GmHk_15G044692 [Glycine max]|nr:hypothetical protein GmHk_15G044692 [Glycine max]